MSIQLVTVILFSSIFVALGLGVPIAFALGGVGTLFILFLWGTSGLYSMVMNAWGTLTGFSFLSIPFFIFMSYILETSGIADSLYEMMYKWFGGLRGGLALGTIVICALFAAMAGISGAATVSMGVIALPSMLKRGYSKTLATGCVQAGGALGILIPPSVTMIIIGLLATVSVGRMYAGGMLAGLLLSVLFMIYIAVRCYFQPHLGPAVPPEERVGWWEKVHSTRAVILPLLLIVSVLGGIIGGVTSISEASAVGAFGALICAAVNRRLDWKMIRDSCFKAVRTTSFVMWVIIGASAFSVFYIRTGAIHMIESIILGLEVNGWVIIVIMQLILVILGCVMETVGIIMVTVPVFFPIIVNLGFDPVWFGVLFVMNMEMAFLTPPYGINLFYIRSVAPPGIRMGDIYNSVWPYVGLQALGLILCMIFPIIIMYLPNLVLGRT